MHDPWLRIHALQDTGSCVLLLDSYSLCLASCDDYRFTIRFVSTTSPSITSE
ncbi:MAG: hypothetical protein KatS3mg031_1247 [Chitinophagales bacterium]|nr:MAG: hypothetical protein KatS3mg031_1247 [Chitinophagales bacterium]